ncbi:MAG TPA: UDP-N-acetylmuramoyl-L-alanine--D-glutamate ligase [Rhizobiaceae bacterium]|nr:UDP-N-acetylmuramoyl-L-alanine--D-glutamate ligase [Rhizobiaceae bacterium]
MIAARTFSGTRVALFGLGGSGLATARALVAGGADAICFDDNPASVEKARAEGIATADLRTIDWSGVATLVLSPGVPLTHPNPHWSVDLAHAAGVPVIGDVEILARERRASGAQTDFVAITGTNGKSTTTALIAHILKSAGRDAQLGGNIGRAVLTLDPPADGRAYVVECSSYQIDLAPSLDASAGILLNLTPDHLDRHGTMAHYAAVKERLVAGAGVSIIGVDDDWCRAIADRLEATGKRVVRISKAQRLADGLFHQDGKLLEATRGQVAEIADLSGIATLRGAHNAQNALAAFAAARACGLCDDEIRAGLASFAGLAHRMQPVARLGKTVFVNDSKATNADAAAPALSSFHDIFWIAGGLPKEGGIASLQPYFARIAKAYLIGEAAAGFAATLGSDVEYEIAGTLEAAVERAAADASHADAREPVVLLSPACASFDQFANFEKRGEAFVNAVMAIEGISQAGGHVHG